MTVRDCDVTKAKAVVEVCEGKERCRIVRMSLGLLEDLLSLGNDDIELALIKLFAVQIK